MSVSDMATDILFARALNRRERGPALGQPSVVLNLPGWDCQMIGLPAVACPFVAGEDAAFEGDGEGCADQRTPDTNARRPNPNRAARLLAVAELSEPGVDHAMLLAWGNAGARAPYAGSRAVSMRARQSGGRARQDRSL
jgi:hypothetical protein